MYLVRIVSSLFVLCWKFGMLIWIGPGSCTDYVAKNNGSFTDAYWEFGAFKVYSAS